jgi:hypothetical protein
MTRAELIRMFVLDSFCDDYEDIEQITKYMDDVGPKCGMIISPDEIVQALRELIELGYATAWKLSCWGEPPQEYSGMPPPADIKHPWGAYFYISPAGMDVHMAGHPGWPFDEEGGLQKDWIAPRA